MEFKIKKNILLKSLSHIQGIVERRNTIPILSNVKIEASENNLCLTATDMDIVICENLKVEVKDPSNITVSAHTLHDIIRKLPDNSEVSFNYKENEQNQALKISSASCNFSLPVIKADDFPTIEIGDVTHNFEIAKKDLLKLLNKAKFAISTEETRYYLNGIYLHDTENNGKPVLRAVATDGHRLARIEVDLPEGAKDIPKIIIPRKTIMEVKRILDEDTEDSNLKISISTGKIQLEYQNISLISKLIDGNFPDYERVIPTNNNLTLTTKVKPLTIAIDRVSTISSDKSKAIKFKLGDDKLILSSDNQEYGFASEELEVNYNDNIIETGFNSKYLLELTSVLDGDTAEFHFSDSSSPTLVKDQNDKSLLYVIMPMRI